MKQFSHLRGKGLFFLIFMAFLWFMSFTGRAILAPLLPFIEDEFSITHAQASSLLFLLSIGYTIALFLNGPVDNLWGKKKSMVASLVTIGAGCLSISFFPIFELFYVAMFFIGFAAGFYLPSAIPLLTAYYEERIWGKVLAIHDSGSGVSLFVAPLLATGLLVLMDWRGVFAVVGTVLIACAIAFAFVAEERGRSVQKDRLPVKNLWRRRELWFLGIVTANVSGASIGFYYIVPLYLTKELAMPAGEANTILGFSRIWSVPVVIGTGFLLDRFNLKKIMLFLTLGSGIATVLLTVKAILWVKVLLIVQPCLLMAFIPALFLSASRLFDEHTRGRATAVLLASGTVIGTGIIPPLLGLAGDLASFRLGILILGIVTSLSTGLILMLKGLK
jgi:NNP family nitrate/nitrite transporter-like MFS transporter